MVWPGMLVVNVMGVGSHHVASIGLGTQVWTFPDTIENGVHLYEIPWITNRYGFGVLDGKWEHQGMANFSFLPKIERTKGEYPGRLFYLYYQARRSFWDVEKIHPTLTFGAGIGGGASKSGSAPIPFIPMIGFGVEKRWNWIKVNIEVRSDIGFINGIIMETGWVF
jgi:hypothetical protein